MLIEKADAKDEYLAQLYELARRKPIHGAPMDEIMRELRGDPDEDPPAEAVALYRQRSE